MHTKQPPMTMQVLVTTSAGITGLCHMVKQGNTHHKINSVQCITESM